MTESVIFINPSILVFMIVLKIFKNADSNPDMGVSGSSMLPNKCHLNVFKFVNVCSCCWPHCPLLQAI